MPQLPRMSSCAFIHTATAKKRRSLGKRELTGMFNLAKVISNPQMFWRSRPRDLGQSVHRMEVGLQ